MDSNPPDVILYTDGACLSHRGPGPIGRGPGGWAVLLRGAEAALIAPDRWRDDFVGDERCKILADFGGPETKSPRMEVTAAIEGLTALKPGCSVTIRSDSEYLVETMTPNSNWKRKPNLDLWEKLDQLVTVHRVRFEHIYGHRGDPWNEAVDRAAKAAARGRP